MRPFGRSFLTASARNEKGVVAIEAAMVFPTFFLFIFGITIVCLTFTKRMMLHESLIAAATSGVRDGALYTGECKTPAVNALIADLGRWPMLLGMTNLTVTAKAGTLVFGNVQTVEFTVSGKVDCPGFNMVLGDTRISASTVVPLDPGASCSDLDA